MYSGMKRSYSLRHTNTERHFRTRTFRLNNRYIDNYLCKMTKCFLEHTYTPDSLSHTNTLSLSVEHSVMKWWQIHEESCVLCSTPLCVCPCRGHMMHIGQSGVPSLLTCQSMFGRGDQRTTLYSLTNKTIMWGQSKVKTPVRIQTFLTHCLKQLSPL